MTVVTDLIVINIPALLKAALWVVFFGWCWFMLKWSDMEAPDSGWVGRSKKKEEN